MYILIYKNNIYLKKKNMTNYTIFNQTSAINQQNLQYIVKSINMLLISVCNDWSLSPIQLSIGTGNNFPNNSLLLQDYTDSPGALGYHYEQNGNSYAKIFVRTILGYGGALLYKDQTTFTVAQCICHELLEMIGNNQTNKWYLDNNGIFWAGELCDPVESNLIVYTLPGNVKVGLSDYVLPNWFGADSTRRPFNKLNTLSTPFSIAAGGYAIIIDNYNIIEIYGVKEDKSFLTGTYSSTFPLLSITEKDRLEHLNELKTKIKKQA
jgi:hypothetical protein